MMRIAFAVLLLLTGAVAGAEDLAVGSKAPPFSLVGSDGKTHTLAEHAGKRGVVLAWFPKAFTPGWTEELKALRDSAEAISAFDVAVYMVSLDDAEKNRAFAEGLDAKHVVLSDPLKEAADSYGVVALAGLYARRWTFYIDESGRIREIDKNVDVATAGQDIARNLETLGFPKTE